MAIGHLLFAGLFILASIHFMERCVHVDSANQIFKWIQFDGVEVEAYRFSAIVPQLIVKAFRFFSADLSTLLWVASVAHVLVPYTIFILAAHVFRTPWIATGCALAAVLATRLTFYGIVLEANYLLCYPFLLAAVLDGPLRERASIGTSIALGIALFMVLAVHPVGFLIALFVLALFWSKLPERRNTLVILACATVLWGAFGRLLLPPSGYESGLYTAAGEGLAQADRFADLPSIEFLLGHTWRYTTHYVPLWSLLLVLAVALVLKRDHWTLMLTLGGVIGYTALNVLTYHAGETAMMMEKNFLPLATLITLPLMITVAGWSVRWQRWAVIPFLLILFIQFRGVSFASRPAHERYEKVHSLVEKVREHGVAKAIVSDLELDKVGLHIHWALAFETLLISASEGPDRCVTAITKKNGKGPEGSNVEFSPFDGNFSTSQLDKRYFQLPETPYVVLTDLEPAPH